MGASERFDRYMEHVAKGLKHVDRHAGLKGYCTGLMLPLSRKSVEPMAARVDPMHASARHQSLHHFVSKAEWSDEEMLRRVCQWVVPKMDFTEGGWWVIDDTGFAKKGRHSVGVARQYCGMLGKQDNCQVAVSVSLVCNQGSLPVAWQLYLPEDWAADPQRRSKAGVPEELRFATKTQIALQQLRKLLGEGAPRHCVLARRDTRAEMDGGDATRAAARTQFRTLRRAQFRVDHERAFSDVAIRVFEELDLPVARRALDRKRRSADQPSRIPLHRRTSVQLIYFVGEPPDRLLAQQRNDAFQSRELRRMEIDQKSAGCDHRVHQRLLIAPHVLEDGDNEIAGEPAGCVSHSRIAPTIAQRSDASPKD